MSAMASTLILVSGAAHAVVNAILKSGSDKVSSRALIDGCSALLVVPLLFFLPAPTGAWLWLAGSWCAHLAYLVCLVNAFARADMTTAYPIMRGTAPVFAAGVATAWSRHIPTVSATLGIGLVSTGVILIAARRRIDLRSVLWALATGVCIAGYTVIDAAGIRAASSPASYICWLFFALGTGIGTLFALWRGSVFIMAASSEWKAGIAAGILSVVTYGSALWAYRLGDVSRLAALRETSVLVGFGIAVLCLKERVSGPQLAGACVIACGAALLLANS